MTTRGDSAVDGVPVAAPSLGDHGQVVRGEEQPDRQGQLRHRVLVDERGERGEHRLVGVPLQLHALRRRLDQKVPHEVGLVPGLGRRRRRRHLQGEAECARKAGVEYKLKAF